MRVNLPEVIRVPVLRAYAWITAIDMSEAGEPIEAYHSINELFVRSLKPGLRPLQDCEIVSPCDSRVLSFGEVKGTTIESIKGQNYDLVFFFTGSKNLQAKEYLEQLKKRKENKLYYVTFYLSPSDHHRFYAPFDWIVRYRRHLYGYLLGVFPLNLRRRKDIYEVNERVVYFGEWKHGFAAFVAVGAYNVGSMQINIDPELATNKTSFPNPLALFEQKEFRPEVPVSKGAEFGRFNTGSTIVLLFEAPSGLEFALTERGKVKIGNGLLSPSGH
jgi:phosphatidylserine decarboxylase